MWSDFRESAGFVAAALIGLGAAAVFFVTNIPEPPPARPAAGDARRRAVRWEEWRTDDFFALAASLDRRDPASVVRQAFEAQRAKKYDLALAYGTDARQRRFTPATMAAQFEQNPGLSRWETLTLGSVERSADRAAVPLKSEASGDEPYIARALLRRDKAGGWSLDVIMAGEAPERSMRESDGAFAARYVLPPLNLYNRSVDRSSARAVVEQALLLCRAGEGAFAAGLFAPKTHESLTLDGFGRWLELSQAWLHRAAEGVVLGEETEGEFTVVVVGVTRPEGSRRLRFWCEPMVPEPEPTPAEFLDGPPPAPAPPARAPAPAWQIVAIGA